MQATTRNKLGKIEKNKKVKEGPCIFPFKYKKQTYTDCVETDKGKICATSIHSKTKTLQTYGYCQEYGAVEPKRSSPKRSSPKRSSPKQSSPRQSSPRRSSPRRSSPKRSIKRSPKRSPKKTEKKISISTGKSKKRISGKIES